MNNHTVKYYTVNIITKTIMMSLTNILLSKRSHIQKNYSSMVLFTYSIRPIKQKSSNLRLRNWTVVTPGEGHSVSFQHTIRTSRVLAIFSFLIWILVIYIYSVCENSVSYMFMIYVRFPHICYIPIF